MGEGKWRAWESANGNRGHMKAAKSVLRYLAGTCNNVGLQFGAKHQHEHGDLVEFADSDHVGRQSGEH